VNIVDQPRRAGATHLRLSLAIGLGLASIAASILLITADGIGGSIHWAHHAGASAAPLLLAAGAITAVSVAYPPPNRRHGLMRLVAAVAFNAWGVAQLAPAPAAAALNDVAILLFVIDAGCAVISDARTVRRPRRSRPAPAASRTPGLHDTGNAVAQRLDLQSAAARTQLKPCCRRTHELCGCATGQ
jgi:hypothetical protein